MALYLALCRPFHLLFHQLRVWLHLLLQLLLYLAGERLLLFRLELALLRLTLLTLALQVRSTLLPTALQCLPPGLAEVVRLLGVGLRHWGCRRRPFAVGWLSGGAEVDAEVGLGLAGHRQSSVYPCLRK